MANPGCNSSKQSLRWTAKCLSQASVLVERDKSQPNKSHTVALVSPIAFGVSRPSKWTADVLQKIWQLVSYCLVVLCPFAIEAGGSAIDKLRTRDRVPGGQRKPNGGGGVTTEQERAAPYGLAMVCGAAFARAVRLVLRALVAAPRALLLLAVGIAKLGGPSYGLSSSANLGRTERRGERPEMAAPRWSCVFH